MGARDSSSDVRGAADMAADFALAAARAFAKRALWRSAGGSTSSAEYCASVWSTHMHRILDAGAPLPRHLAELGPGNSVGVCLAALLSGVETAVALDVARYRPLRNPEMLEELVRLLEARPASDRAMAVVGPERLAHLRELAQRGQIVRYVAPWNDQSAIERASVDTIISTAVLEHVDDLDGTYAAMALWLAPGGWMSHSIDLGSHKTSRHWNGHWRYPDRAWRLVAPPRGGMNREPASAHIRAAESAGFRIVRLDRDLGSGLPPSALGARWRSLDPEDLATRSIYLLAVKRASGESG